MRGTPANLEAIGEAGLAYDQDDAVEGLTAVLRQVVTNPDSPDPLRAAAHDRMATVYAWDRIIHYDACSRRC